MTPTLSKRELATLSDGQLKDLANRGIVRVMNAIPKPVCERCFTDYPQYKKHARLAGRKISINEASRQYHIHTSTITRWMQRYPIPVLQRTKREVYLDRAVMAYCAEIYAERGGQGRRLFNADLTPYVNSTHRSRAA